jgi:hypothetical protein
MSVVLPKCVARAKNAPPFSFKELLSEHEVDRCGEIAGYNVPGLGPLCEFHARETIAASRADNTLIGILLRARGGEDPLTVEERLNLWRIQ